MSNKIIGALILLAFVNPLRAQELNDETEKIIKSSMMRAAPSVVQIETSGGTETVGAGGPGAVIKGVGPTTGVVVAPDGYVITSAFNFANKPTAVFVTIPGQKERKVAKTIATDQTRMITLIKVEATGLQVPKAVPKKDVRIGQWAVALGRTLDPNVNNPPSTSAGIISALDRIWGKAFQTDAKVSPVNYGGPLVDVEGRVYGILVPANPFADGDTAGVEWYDSGIGFAIPFEDVLAAFPRLQKGKDLRKGLLGVSPTGRDIYSGYSKVSNVSPESTAAKAGIKVGDEIIEVDGKPVLNHAQLLHAMGPKYEGDTVSVKIRRDKEEKKFDNLVLSGSLVNQAGPSLGILPMRDDPAGGVEVRYVFPKGPADEAGIKAGDRIMKFHPPSSPGGPTTPAITFSGRDQFMQLLEGLSPGAQIKLDVKRKDGGKTDSVTVRVGSEDTTVPEKLPEQEASAKKALERPKPMSGPGIPNIEIKPGDDKPPRPGNPPRPPGQPKPGQPKPGDDKPQLPKPAGSDKPDTATPPRPKDGKTAETGLLKRTNEAKDHEYWVLVPQNYDPNVAHGLVIWLHAVGTGGKDAGDLREIWEEICERYHLIMLGPKAENDSGWVASESEFIAATARSLMSEYTIDTQRVVAHGMGVGGQMAFYLGFNARDLVRGVATTSAVLATQPKDTAAGQRLQFFIVAGTKDPSFKDISKSKAALGEKKYPVLYREIEMGKQYLDSKTLFELVRWIDCLDRL